MKKKTNEEYIDELHIKNPNVEVVEQYIDTNTKIMHHCLIHDVHWMAKPANVLQGSGCDICKKEKFLAKRRKTQEQYETEVSKISSHIAVLGSYVDARTPILHKCMTHNVEWNAQPGNILKGIGCYNCGKEKIGAKNKKEYNQYINELAEINPNVVCVGEYINSTTPVLHRCLKDNYEWRTIPSYLLSRRGCPKCSGHLRKNQKDYIDEVSMINPDIEVIGSYINAKTPILHRCKIDGHTWNTSPAVILIGCGCPQCNESSGERQIRQWLNSHKIEYEFQKVFSDCKDKAPLPFDFYLPDYNAVIEYDGEQHYKSIKHFGGDDGFFIRTKHDKIKNNYCQSNDIIMIRIPYFKNVSDELNNFLFI